jgi:Protein of unknown function (DUF3788)
MAIGFFLDKEHQPSPEEILVAMGVSAPLWERLVRFIADTYQMPGEWSYGGKKYGWNLWYRKSGKSLTSLYPQQGHLVVQIVLGREEGERALALPLGDHVGQMLRDAQLLHDGRWLFIPVTSETDAADVEQLLLVKRRPAKTKS